MNETGEFFDVGAIYVSDIYSLPDPPLLMNEIDILLSLEPVQSLKQMLLDKVDKKKLYHFLWKDMFWWR